jgi:hypothetical protein
MTQVIVDCIVMIMGTKQTTVIYFTITEEAQLCYRMLRNVSTRSVLPESLRQKIARTKLLVGRKNSVVKIVA